MLDNTKEKMKSYNTSLFIFRRDLRLTDNTGLNNALKQSKKVIPCFIFDPRQVKDNNKYKSDNAIQFMIESLQGIHDELRKQDGKLYLFYGKAEEVIKTIITQEKIDAVFLNRDYTPFSIERDKKIAKICTDNNIFFESSGDALLNEPEIVTKKDGTYYSVFSAFYKKAMMLNIKEPVKQHQNDWFTGSIKNSESTTTICKTILTHKNKNIALSGGRDEGDKILKNLKLLKDYTHEHNYPAITTSHLSAHLKFGTISVREVYHAIIKHLGRAHPLLRQLYWRDFFTHIAYHVPAVFGHPYKKKYAQLPWSDDKTRFKAWCTGQTGFPIVDAGMRELNSTGFMHNRVRMIVASFLVKDLHINWLWGEKYFAQQLVDYDPAVNNGNWQWCASTGCDAQPYFRIFNPWLQQKKYDPECLYIKKWVPELQEYDTKIIHNWFKENSPVIKGYPRPIIDHKKESYVAKKLFASAK
jgi:deoxyribodipyrimidine photo-lyase